jgi:hypothetical protein
MGNSQSTVTNIVNKSSLSVANDFVSTTIATTQASSTNIQTFTLNIGAMNNCPLSLGQTINAQVSAISTVNDTQAQQLQTSLSTALNAAAQSNSDMVNGVMAATGGNEQDTRTNITNTIEQSVRNAVTATTINQVAATSVNTQTMTLNIGACMNSPIQANQGIVSNVIAQNILTKVSNAIVSSNLVSAATANASTTTGMHNQGLNDLVDSIFKGLTGIWGIIALVVCVAICGVLAFLLSPAGQESSVKLANAGASKIKGPSPF